MLTDMKLKALKPTGKIYKVADQRGLYVAVTRTGVVGFRFDYRINGRRETLVIGQYDSSLGARKPRDAEELDNNAGSPDNAVRKDQGTGSRSTGCPRP